MCIKPTCKLNTAGQIWVNDLANFNFSINYKPGIQNNVADIESRLPNSSRDRERQEEACSVEKKKAILDGSTNQIDMGEIQVPILNNINAKTG